MRTLVEELAAAGSRLTKRVMDEMYRDPFWMERYGQRGRQNADTDGDFHIKYIVSAIEADDPTLFVTYGRWLRDLLIPRGMCSQHIIENFERLADAIGEEGWTGREMAIAILHGGARGLRYTTGDAATIDANRTEWRAQLGDPADHLLSYLADALATRQRTGFDAYVAFLEKRMSVQPMFEKIAALPGIPPAAVDIVEGR